MKLSQRRHFLSRMASWAAAGIVLAIAGCGGSSPEQSGKQEVEFWTMQLQPKFTDYFDQLIAEFEAANPEVDVVWVDVPWSDMQSKILTAVSAGTAPDVVNLNPDFASQLASRNAWLSLDDQLSAEEQAIYLPKIWQATTLNGDSFGFPWYLTTRVTLFNAELLEQADISEPPATYEELAAAAKQIKETTGKYAFFISFVPEDAADVLQSFIQMGVPLVDADGNAAFNTPDGKAVFQYWTDLYQQELLPREVLTQGHRRAIELYQAGETAFLSSGAEALANIANNAPDIAEATQAAPQITGKTGKKNVAAMNLLVPRSTDVPEAAVKFALYVTNNDNQVSFAQAANVLPSTAAAVDSTLTTAPDGATSIEIARTVSASQLADAEVLIPALEDVKKLQKAIYDNLQATMLGEKTVDEAIADAAAEWDNR
ncbi:sugar ABC transporter substrate-binding protein [Leptolyngbya cf. ectocarpi LEGE 11479]|uniref:Sugar ABC transporter substrate-binding protein n=1 Tax=Leptolyngbya cf. ectocarpi LEGE 11479 TaxID=1828722 RepID=A0A928ZTK4_LEPEC|nr:sugar ABC transporter substrate-binding protein [Leptolyngbya ectocarpi]MBE9065939.1 sugar ABC transporter substrate-binding protein [Leptolyngbya cf. ectocarpi LEGE 11479]